MESAPNPDESDMRLILCFCQQGEKQCKKKTKPEARHLVCSFATCLFRRDPVSAPSASVAWGMNQNSIEGSECKGPGMAMPGG